MPYQPRAKSDTWLICTPTPTLNNSQIITPEPQHSPSKTTTPLTNLLARRFPQQGIELIKEFEGYAKQLPDGRAQAHANPIHGWHVPTIGYGTTTYPNGSKVQPGDIITHAEAEAYLITHLELSIRAGLERIPAWHRMGRKRRGAMYSFAYNLGAGFYRSHGFESITRVCDSPEQWTNKAWIKEQFVKYCKPGSPTETRLRQRREAEAALFCS